MSLSLSLMKTGGQMVVIIPRSFCNGPYYLRFLEFLLQRSALRHMHLFAFRNKAFRDDDVLQENHRSGRMRRRSGPVTASHSTNDSYSDLVEYEHPFDRIAFPSDPESFIHVPTSLSRTASNCCVEYAPACPIWGLPFPPVWCSIFDCSNTSRTNQPKQFLR